MILSRLGAYAAIVRLVWPLALGMMNNAVMQFVDRAFLSRHSMEALEAVLPASTLAWVFMSFFQSVTGYAGVFVAQYHGAGNVKMTVAAYRAGLLMAGLSGLLMLPCLPLGNWLFAVTAVSPAVVPLERAYFTLVGLGGVFLFAQMAAVAFFTGRGLTRIVFWVNLFGNALNIALDPLLIFGCRPLGIPELGIAGAALATVAAQVVQLAILLVAAHREVRRLKVAAVAGVRQVLVRILRYGLPSGGYEVLNMFAFTAFVFVSGRVGEVEFAVSNACFTVNYLLFAPMMGFALGAQTLVGQHLGRRDEAGAALAFRRTLILGLALVGLVGALTLVFRGPILELFAPTEAERYARFMALGPQLLMLMAGWMLFDAADVILAGALKGAGDTRFVFVLTLVCSFVLWLPAVLLVLELTHSITALWATMLGYVLILTAGSCWRWCTGRWRQLSILG